MLFSIFDFPKLTDDSVLRDAIARGTEATLGYVSAAQVIDGALEATRPELLRIGDPTRPDEIDLGSGCFVLSASFASRLAGAYEPDEGVEGQGDGDALDEETVADSEGTEHGARRYAGFETRCSGLRRRTEPLSIGGSTGCGEWA